MNLIDEDPGMEFTIQKLSLLSPPRFMGLLVKIKDQTPSLPHKKNQILGSQPQPAPIREPENTPFPPPDPAQSQLSALSGTANATCVYRMPFILTSWLTADFV